MKIRNGFVSNSSSSSFIFEGVKIDENDLAKILGLNIDELNMDEIDCLFEEKLNPLEVRRICGDDRYYREYLIGYCIGNPDQNEVKAVEIEVNDCLKSRLKEANIPGTIKFYFQFRSG